MLYLYCSIYVKWFYFIDFVSAAIRLHVLNNILYLSICFQVIIKGCGSTCSSGDDDIEQGRRTPFRSRPLIIYRGHEGVITDLVWSKNLFLLATGMDKQVRLWHISRRECLCIFSHNDTVPTVVFHPKVNTNFFEVPIDAFPILYNYIKLISTEQFNFEYTDNLDLDKSICGS